MLRTTLPDPVYVALIRSMGVGSVARLAGFAIASGQAVVAAAHLHDPLVTAGATFAVLCAIARVATQIAWQRARLQVRDVAAARFWEAAMSGTALPFSAAMGLTAAATMATGDTTWTLIEGMAATLNAAAVAATIGVRPAFVSVHLTLLLGPIGAIFASHGDIPHVTLAVMMLAAFAFLRANGTGMYAILVARLTLEQQAVERAHRDPLTGLSNRLAFDDAVANRETAGDRYVLMLVDLDGFKPVNDGWGHAAGDAVLVAVATRLRDIAGESAAFRIGGDEFAVLAAPDRAEALASDLVDACRAPVEYDGRTLRVGGSVGMAVGPDPAIRERADEALYAAKRAGRNRWQGPFPTRPARLAA